MARKPKKKHHIGKIYAVDPKHLIPITQRAEYNHAKGVKAGNKRLVVITVEKSASKVQVSPMTSKATNKQIIRKQKVRLLSTYPSKFSYVDTNTIAKSKQTNKHFKIGHDPLKQHSKIVHPIDIKKVKAAQAKRHKKIPTK